MLKEALHLLTSLLSQKDGRILHRLWAHPQGCLSPGRLHLLKVPISFQLSAPAEKWMFKYISLWGIFFYQIITISVKNRKTKCLIISMVFPCIFYVLKKDRQSTQSHKNTYREIMCLANGVSKNLGVRGFIYSMLPMDLLIVSKLFLVVFCKPFHR